MSSGNNITWAGTFTPSTNTEDASNALSLATSYTDLAGNPGPAETTSNYAVETRAPTVSSFTLSDSALKIGDNATVTLVFSEEVILFNSDSDITQPNGELSTMTTNANETWIGYFTPNLGIEDDTNTLSLANNSYTDLAGNNGPDNQTANYQVDTRAPSANSFTTVSYTHLPLPTKA